ncbi:MAG: hypothetical protein QNJ98_15825 [Planctomycetota bacterium]|nr:hypothetical protein [Planctomycetota bacterium]
MRRRVPLFALVLLLAGVPARAEDASTERVAWFATVAEARAAAEQGGRPIWVALHPRGAGTIGWPYDGKGWSDVYAAPEVVSRSRRFACVRLRVGGAPARGDAEHDARPEAANRFVAPAHLVLDATGTKLLARVEGWTYKAGAESVKAISAFLDAAWSRLPEAPRGAAIGPADVDAATRRGVEVVPGSSELTPLPMGIDAAGFRTRLRWTLPVPVLEVDKPLRAGVSMYWDGAGPFDLGAVDIPAGKDADVPVDVRYADHPGLEPLITKGRHRVDVYIEPVPGSFQFSDGPLFVGLVWIELGDGGGGGGGGGTQPEPQEQPEAQDPNAPEPQPDEPAPQPELQPPPPGDEHVVEPFVREGDEVEKDDAIVGVESEDAAVKPPPPTPNPTPPREFETQLEESVNWERIPLTERAFLKRYFEALRRALDRAEKDKDAGK